MFLTNMIATGLMLTNGFVLITGSGEWLVFLMPEPEIPPGVAMA
jgi:hypothetical protein